VPFFGILGVFLVKLGFIFILLDNSFGKIKKSVYRVDAAFSNMFLQVVFALPARLLFFSYGVDAAFSNMFLEVVFALPGRKGPLSK
jgi:hypothetical protein